MDSIRSLGLIPTREAAERLDCTVQHVRLLIRQGRIAGERIGRDWFVEAGSVQTFAALRYDQKLTKPEVIREPQVESLFADAALQSVVNVASVPQRSPFRYPGGKTWLIPIVRLWLGSLKPPPKLLVEPFAGGGGISLAAAFEKYVGSSLLVELDPEVAAVWKVLIGGKGPDLAQRIRSFDLNEESVRPILAEKPSTLLEQAFQTIIRNRVSRGGILAPGAGLVKNGEAGKGMASRWYPETLAKRIEAIHQQRSSLSFREGDGLEVLRENRANPQASFFIDPPYPIAGRRLYRFYQLDHRELFEEMSLLEGPWLATYDHNPHIEKLAQEFDFETRLVPMKSTHHEKKFELLISRTFEWLPLGLSG